MATGCTCGTARARTISSSSTGASSGSTATPTALRACRPASPKTSRSSWLAPLPLRLAGEVRGARHENQHLDHLGDRVQIARLGRDGGERVQRSGPRTVCRLINTDPVTHLAGCDQPTIDDRQLA